MKSGHSQAPIGSSQKDSERLLTLERRLLEEEAEKNVLLSLSKDITSCRSREDVRQLLSTMLSKHFRHQDLMVSLNEPDNLTYRICVLHATEEAKQRFKSVDGEELKFFMNDGIFNVSKNPRRRSSSICPNFSREQI